MAFWVRTGTTGGDSVKGEIRRLEIGGGSPYTIASLDYVPNGITWDGEWLVFAQSNGSVMRVRAGGSAPETLVDIKKGEQARGPQLLNDDALLLVVRSGASVVPTSEWDQAEIVVHSLASGERRTLTRGTAARVLPTGHLVFMQRGAMMAAPFDLRRLMLTGPAVPVIEGVLRATTGGPAGGGNSLGDAHFAVSDSGTLAYVAGPPLGALDERRLVLVDRAGKLETLPPPPGPYEAPRVSPDGKRLAVGTIHSSTRTISIYDLSGVTALQRLTFDGNNRFPVWSIDGQYVAFQSDRAKDLAIFQQRADGSMAAERLTTPAEGVSHVPQAWFPGGDLLLYRETKGGLTSLLVYSAKSKSSVPMGGPPARRPAQESHRMGAGSSTRRLPGKRGGISLQPFPSTGAVYRYRPHPGCFPTGHQTGSRRSSTKLNQIWAVDVTTTGRVTIGNPVALSRQVGIVLGPVFDYDVTPDGRFLSASSGWTEPERQEIQVVLNWFEELKARVPSK